MRITRRALLPLVAIPCALTCAFAGEGARVEGKNIRIDFDGKMHSRVVAVLGGREHVIGSFTPSEFIVVSGREVRDFSLEAQKHDSIRDPLGPGLRVVLTGSRIESCFCASSEK